jgi:predicted dehydrogenase
MDRRNMLKTISAAVGASLSPSSFAALSPSSIKTSPKGKDYRKPDRPLTCVVIGAGNRGGTYARYAEKYPDEWQIVGVAEPILHRKQRMAGAHKIPKEQCFVTWEHVFERPRFADVAIITTPDRLHYGPAMAALEQGYDLLLEKPIAQSWKQCKAILDLSRKMDRIVAVCHVLRYTPYFRYIKQVVESGQLGKIASIQHLEPIGYAHFTSSFVRGSWRNSKQATPLILSKSCHDLDIIRWIVGRSCQKVSSFGSLTLFRSEMAPKGATMRCTDACPIEHECPFSAIRIYVRDNLWGTNALRLERHDKESVMKALREGPYGRCVYHCDNDVPDHQITNMEFEGGTTVAFSLEALTSYSGRRTRITGTKGDLVGNGQDVDISIFLTGKKNTWNPKMSKIKIISGHGGGDWGLVRDFVQAVSRRDPSLLSSTIEASIESHLIGFKAEESRHQGGKVMKVDIDAG